MKNFYTFFVLFLMAIWAGPVEGQKLDMSKLPGLSFRNIGPAGMSGRVTAIDVVLKNPSEIIVGSASGGLWKTNNGGINWKPIFDGQKSASIGDVAIFQNNPEIIYVGTGEGNPRNSQSSGNGMYKSIDGGKSWTHLGLDKTRNIHRVIVDPNNSDIVYVGAIGSAWASTSERGVYKTTDGGKSWKKILYVNESTGVADMVMDPSNPNKLIVAMWEYRRWPWFFKSGGKGSGLYVTIDGGANWNQKTDKNGLPKGELGRMGVAIAPSNPDVVYALVESKKNALYRSTDGGNSWRMTADKNVGDRPFYYAEIYVDPSNENRVYNIFTNTTVSEDGGKTFRPLMGFFSVHSDHQAFWINPENPAHIIDGNDGGLYMSMDKGKSWKFHHNLPLGQFYHINVDNELPYNVLGGLQDNGSWSGPAYKWRLLSKIRNDDFVGIGFGDGFDVIPDPDDSRYGYSLSQGGNLMRYDKQLGLVKVIQPQSVDETKLRFNWDAGIAQDPFDNSTIYIGSQFLHKSTDKGSSWTIISPDLTTNDPEKQKQFESGGLTTDNTAAENYTTITVIAPSAMEKNVIWVGTDDGNVQLTMDGGSSWTNVTKNIKGVAANSWVAQIKASGHAKGEAFIVFDDHRRNNWSPYVFKTTNYGKSWTRLVDENDVWGYALSVVQDPVEPRLLFVGTEFGVYVSVDAGENWSKWKKDFPTASAMDMIIHPREHDLVVGTFGRSVWILDDIRPLRALAGQNNGIADKSVHVFEIPDTYQAVVGMPRFFSGSNDVFAGTNRPMGAMLSYWSKTASKKDSVSIVITGPDGKEFRLLKATAKAGVNRMNWDLKKEGPKYPGPPDPFSSFFSNGIEALPGDYTVTVKIGKDSSSQKVKVIMDPKMPVDMEAYKTNLARKARFQKAVSTTTKAYGQLTKAEKGIKKVSSFLSDRKDESSEKIKASAKELQKKMDELKYKGLAKKGKGIQGDTDDLVAQLKSLGFYFFNMMTAPGQSEEVKLSKIEEQVQAYEKDVNDFVTGDVAKFKEEVNAADIKLFGADK